MTEGPVWIAEQDVKDVLTLPEAIDVLADSFALLAAGEASNMRRAHVAVGDSILHAVGGTLAGSGVAGTKTWLYTPRGASPVVIVYSLEDGSLLAAIEAFALGQLRTAATSGLGTKLLAREDAATLALIGTGKQAFAQASAVAAVRPISTIRLFGRDPGRRGDLAARLGAELGVSVEEFDDVQLAVAEADVVTTITRSVDPILSADGLPAGLHINAVGSIVATKREIDESVLGRAACVVVDSLDQAREDAGELKAAVTAGELDWSDVHDLSAVVGRSTATLRSPQDVTVFKALGVGLSDVAIGAEILRRCRAAGAGRVLASAADLV